MNETMAVTGIPEDEITLSEVLQARGYKTSLFGKWHLGDQSPSLPNDKGFDCFYGSHYSNDMVPYHFFRNREIADKGVLDQTKITGMLTEEILRYVDENADNPFFIFYASPKPHHPIYAGERFQGTSQAGAYGDCIQEVDWSVGEIVKKLEEKGIAEKTLVVFTSDNGPWHQGSPGLHRGRKGNTFDGGQIVPMIATWPSTIPAGRTSDAQMMNIDFFATFLAMAGIDLPTDRVIDGQNLLPLMTGESAESPHEELFYVMYMGAYALRHRDHFKYYATATSENSLFLWMGPLHPFLFDLNVDPNESYDQRAHYPDRARRMRDRLYAFNREMETNPRGWLD
jgi:arylsulfatase A-like enzyme